MKILDSINGHQDLIQLDNSQRQQLCQEIREFLVENISKTGGHLASNLGVVELTVAIETVFDTNSDRLVFDVGHQSYVHKLLTGRRADFAGLRQMGGMAGFPKPGESNCDAFVAGHASSSVSIALGMARARTLMQEDYHVVALIGDGAATGGMVYEGINDAGVSREPMIVILNDNEMSIDRNVGGIARHLSKLRTKERYLGMKHRYRQILSKLPGGKWIYNVTRGIKNKIKQLILPGTLFESMGFTYIGPVDGHDLPELITLLQSCKQMNSPVLIHVLTQKGKGYRFAEEKPSKFHGVGRFDPKTGVPEKKACRTFSDAFGQTMVGLAHTNDKICAITAAMPGGTGLLDFKKLYPSRTFDVGIAEEHAVSMAGGLAKQGLVPVVAIYSTFLQRAYDQILQDISMLKLHVVLAVDRAGLVGEDGETHHGVFDVGYLRHAPGMTILAPASCDELEQMMRWAVNVCAGPVAVRYPRGGDGVYTESAWDPCSGIAVHRQGKDCAIVTYGTLINQATEAADLLAQQGIDTSVIRLTRLNPLPIAALKDALGCVSKLLIAEEASAGIAEALAWHLGNEYKISITDLGREYVPHGSCRELYEQYGLDSHSLTAKMKEALTP